MLRLVTPVQHITPVLVLGAVELPITREQAMAILSGGEGGEDAAEPSGRRRRLSAPIAALPRQLPAPPAAKTRQLRQRVQAGGRTEVAGKTRTVHTLTKQAASQAKKGLCQKCDKKVVKGRKLCRTHLETILAAQRKAVAARKKNSASPSQRRQMNGSAKHEHAGP